MTIKTTIPDFYLREAGEADVPLILQFIRELAEYEKLSHEVIATEDDIHESLFGHRPVAEVVIGYYKGAPVSFALFYHNYSTFLGKPGIYLEDLFVKPLMRGKGIGKSMLAYLAKLACDRNCGRFEWWVLNWNKPALKFYHSVGAQSMSEWTVQRLEGEALKTLAGEFGDKRNE
jgi:GNAT superfamily N-acetyltransferase